MRGNWPSCTACWVIEKTPEITAWLAMMAAKVASITMRIMRPMRHDGEEGDAGLVGIAQQRRALAEIIQQQRRQRDEEPGIADRLFAEMAHVGIKRLAAGHRQHHRAQRHEGDPGRVHEQSEARKAD